MPTPIATLFCSDDDVKHLLSALGARERLDDDNSGSLDLFEQGAMTQALSFATSRVKFYCQGNYDDQDLAGSWMANEWATIIASYWLCTRRGNPVPTSLRELMFGGDGKENKGAMGDLADVRSKRAQIPDIGYRNVEWPAWSNVRVDPRYRLRQLRVERPISEKTPTQYTQNIDWPAEYTFEI